MVKMVKKYFNLLKHKFSRLGPGFITGAADDDPSGIATYSIAGAQFGYKLNFLSLFTFPMMVAIQEMCGRIGMVSGMGLAGCIKKYYSKKLLLTATLLLLIANTINIGADLGMMAASMQMILGLPFFFWLIIITLITLSMEILVPYDKYSRYLKWMGLSLLVYGLTAFLTNQNWLLVIRYTLIPSLELNLNYFMTIVAFIGTSISPYLFFWQASEEVEEAILEGKITEFEETPTVLENEIRHMQKDTTAGMFFSQLIAFFIILTTTSTLHANGIIDIETPQQVALALRPLAGDLAYILFTIGIVGIGLQSVPILAGSAAYAFADSFGFKEGLAKKLTEAKIFYLIIGLSTIIGALMNLIGINPIKALFYTAIINGLVSVPLIAIIIKLANDERIIGKHKTGKWGNILGWTTFCLMAVSVLIMFVFLLRK